VNVPPMSAASRRPGERVGRDDFIGRDSSTHVIGNRQIRATPKRVRRLARQTRKPR
jgi:hypothetical protein